MAEAKAKAPKPAQVKEAKAKAPEGPQEIDVPAAIVSLADRVTELEGDLVRVVDLLIKGDLDSAKFREILAKRQGKAKVGA